jgi:hypothetical protein
MTTQKPTPPQKPFTAEELEELGTLCIFGDED